VLCSTRSGLCQVPRHAWIMFGHVLVRNGNLASDRAGFNTPTRHALRCNFKKTSLVYQHILLRPDHECGLTLVSCVSRSCLCPVGSTLRHQIDLLASPLLLALPLPPCRPPLVPFLVPLSIPRRSSRHPPHLRPRCRRQADRLPSLVDATKAHLLDTCQHMS
jgi:hypothetical protein